MKSGIARRGRRRRWLIAAGVTAIAAAGVFAKRAAFGGRATGARLLLPVHWGLFALASHGWTEPIERVLVGARDAGAVVICPRPGQSVEPAAPTAERPQEHWWPKLPWRTGAENPIVAHQGG